MYKSGVVNKISLLIRLPDATHTRSHHPSPHKHTYDYLTDIRWPFLSDFIFSPSFWRSITSIVKCQFEINEQTLNFDTTHSITSSLLMFKCICYYHPRIFNYVGTEKRLLHCLVLAKIMTYYLGLSNVLF